MTRNKKFMHFTGWLEYDKGKKCKEIDDHDDNVLKMRTADG